jgi:hypothetical protein
MIIQYGYIMEQDIEALAIRMFMKDRSNMSS